MEYKKKDYSIRQYGVLIQISSTAFLDRGCICFYVISGSSQKPLIYSKIFNFRSSLHGVPPGQGDFMQ